MSAEHAIESLSLSLIGPKTAFSNREVLAVRLYQLAGEQRPSQVFESEDAQINAALLQNGSQQTIPGTKMPISAPMREAMRLMRQYSENTYKESKASFFVQLARRFPDKELSRLAAVAAAEALLEAEHLNSQPGSRLIAELRQWFLVMAAAGVDRTWGIGNDRQDTPQNLDLLFAQCCWLIRVRQLLDAGGTRSAALQTVAGEYDTDPRYIVKAMGTIKLQF